MRIAAAQLNQTVGDFRGNAERIIAAAHEAASQGVQVLLTPEFSLAGYPPEDLLLRTGFQRRCDEALVQVAQGTAQLDLHLLVGHPLQEGGARYNAASLLHQGVVQGVARKHELPNYQVFDEDRYFEPGQAPFVFEVGGVRLAVAICEDIWFSEVPRALRKAGAQIVLVLNASPYDLDKQGRRIETARAHLSAEGMAVVTANLAGAQDELVFDGRSFALNASGDLVAQALAYVPQLLVVDVEPATDGTATPRLVGVPASGHDTAPAAWPAELARAVCAPDAPLEAQVYGALMLGVRDYIGKNGFPGALLGFSGGADSALVLAIAADALGSEKVRAVMMPSPYTAEISWVDSRDMAGRLGVRYEELPIAACFDAFRATLAEPFRGLAEDTTEENLQARIRGTLLMALSNKTGAIVLTTGNKSEMAVGYATLYGDMAGGFAVLKDVFKTLVWRLCRWRNSISEVIPERIITRAPSAELRPDQTDQDSLPPYDQLDAIVSMYMERDCSVEDIVAAGHPEAVVRRVAHLMRISEYKRRQAPIGVRVTHRGFGRDWRYPITSKFRD